MKKNLRVEEVYDKSFFFWNSIIDEGSGISGMKETDSVENTKTKFRKKWNGEIYHQSQNTNVWAIEKYL